MTISIADANFLLGWRNHVLYEDATWQLDSGTVVAGDLSALATMQLSDRVTIQDTVAGVGHANIVLHWFVPEGTPVPIQLLGLLNYELTAPGAVDPAVIQVSVLSASEDPGVVDLVVTPWQRPSGDFQRHLWTILDTEISAGYWVTVIVDAGFGEGGGTLTLTAGGLWTSALWTLPNGLARGWRTRTEDSGVMKESLGLQGYPRRGVRRRVFAGQAVDIDGTWAYGADDGSILDVQQLQYRVGNTEPVVLFPRTRRALTDPRSVHVMHRLGVYGHFRQLGEIVHDKADVYQWTGIEVAELM